MPDDATTVIAITDLAKRWGMSRNGAAGRVKRAGWPTSRRNSDHALMVHIPPDAPTAPVKAPEGNEGAGEGADSPHAEGAVKALQDALQDAREVNRFLAGEIGDLRMMLSHAQNGERAARDRVEELLRQMAAPAAAPVGLWRRLFG